MVFKKKEEKKKRKIILMKSFKIFRVLMVNGDIDDEHPVLDTLLTAMPPFTLETHESLTSQEQNALQTVLLR